MFCDELLILSSLLYLTLSVQTITGCLPYKAWHANCCVDSVLPVHAGWENNPSIADKHNMFRVIPLCAL